MSCCPRLHLFNRVEGFRNNKSGRLVDRRPSFDSICFRHLHSSCSKDNDGVHSNAYYPIGGDIRQSCSRYTSGLWHLQTSSCTPGAATHRMNSTIILGRFRIGCEKAASSSIKCSGSYTT